MTHPYRRNISVYLYMGVTTHRPAFYFLVLSNLGSINIGCVPETEEVYPFQCRYLYGSTTPTARGFTSQFYQIWEVLILVVFP